MARAWSWVPSLYFLEGLPYVVANNVSVALYKTLEVSNTQIAFLTSWLSLVWAAKALWSPFIDGVSTKRRWVVAMQFAMVPALAVIALSLPLPHAVTLSLVLFFVMAFASATHDVAADGFYMLGLTKDQQAAFVGVRSTFWRMALIFGEGGLIVLAGVLGKTYGPVVGWQLTLGIAALIFAVGAVYHALVLPHAPEDVPRTQPAAAAGLEAVKSFFAKKDILRGIAFIEFFRFAENHMSKLIIPFLNDPRDIGGLGLSLEQIGIAKGTVGVVCLVLGGILGGLAIYKHGLKAWLWPMVIAVNVPNLLYVYLAMAQPTDFPLICGIIGVEQFGYGFGLSAYMMYLIHLADGPYKTTHYAFATGLMAFAVWDAQVWSGAMQEALGYAGFFQWVLLLSVPAFVVVALVRVPDDHGKKA
jgi:MFS transporter, PAT family, beta-lactamase induction signal transducer AmpG